MAVLRSNCGEYELSFAPEEPASSHQPDSHGPEIAVRLRGQHWDGDHDHEFGLTIGGILLSRDRARQLCDALGEYLGRSLAELASTVLTGRHSLAEDSAQTLDLLFGPRDDVTNDGKPVVTVEIRVDFLRASCCWVVDASCLENFAAGLAALVEGRQE